MPNIFNSSYEFILQHSSGLFYFRLMLISLLFYYWPEIITLIANKKHWSKEKNHYWQTQRLRFFMWLIVFEIILHV